MAKYIYRAINEQGKNIFGTVEADSPEAANDLVLKMGHIPAGISKSMGFHSDFFAVRNIRKILHPVRTRDLIIFTKQFRTMFRTGVPMLELLQILEKQTENLTLKTAIASISASMREGYSLSEAFKKHPRIFSPLYCSVLHAGERSGALSNVLDRLGYIMEHEEKIKSDIKAALWYPAYVTGFLCVAFFVLLIFVIPKFVTIFQTHGLVLPLPTRICLWLYNIFINWWPIFLFSFLLAGSVLYLYLKTGQGKYVRDLLFIKIPIFGTLFVKSSMSRFASIFSILQYSGVSVMESMGILSGTIGNTAISREFEGIRTALRQGSSIASTLRSARYFPPMVINMVAIGEKTEKLDEMLSEISKHYDSEVEYAMKGVTESITPLLTISIAFVVGFFALAVFLPMWDMTKIVR
ncbi:MAG: type II secretion system F family protein [Desulfobacterales bacterium]